MICQRCGLLQKILYRCEGCYGQVDDSDMCQDCKREHIEENEGIDDMVTFVELEQ